MRVCDGFVVSEDRPFVDFAVAEVLGLVDVDVSFAPEGPVKEMSSSGASAGLARVGRGAGLGLRATATAGDDAGSVCSGERPLL